MSGGEAWERRGRGGRGEERACVLAERVERPGLVVGGEERECAADRALRQAGRRTGERFVGAAVSHEERHDLVHRERAQAHREQTGPDGVEERVGIARGEDQRGVGRRLLEQLEQRVGGLGAGLLGDEPLGGADEEHLAAPHGGPDAGEAAQRLDLGEEDADGLGRRGGAQRIGASGLELGGAGVLECVGELLRPARAPGPGEREEPVDIGVLEAG